MVTTRSSRGSRARRVSRPTVALALVTLATALAAGCSSGTLSTTDAQGSTTSRVRPPAGTILVADASGENAAVALGKTVAVIPASTTQAPSTTATTTATASTSPTVLTPTTQPPVTAPRTTVATVAPVTQGPVTSLTIPKPALTPISMGALSPDERAIVNGINTKRAASGLAAVAPEQHATDAARQHTAEMIAAGQPSNVVDVFNKVNAQYRTITQLTFNWSTGEDATQYLLTQYGSQVSGPFTSVGIGVAVSAGQRWVTVLLGA